MKHLALSWDISAEGERWGQLNNRLQEKLNSYQWVRPLSTFYVVAVSGASDRESIREDLVEVSKAVPESINIIISPTIKHGQRYNGYLPSSYWDKINELTG